MNKMLIDIINDALSGKKESLLMRLRIMVKKLQKDSPQLAESLETLIINNQGIGGERAQFLKPKISPVDADSRLNLLVETYPVQINVEPIWSEETYQQLNRFVAEWHKKELLYKEGLNPSISLLMAGPPGVGKTLAAKWLASKLDMPLLTLDLASVMSSFLGKTGNNIKAVLNYASTFPCVLLLDEFDAIAKKRDDASDVGELKRLVTVLLQAIDDWPSTSVLIAATNHAELLDPAVWRRFDRVTRFEYPSQKLIEKYLISKDISVSLANYISIRLDKMSYSVLEKAINQAKRNSILERIPLSAALIDELLSSDSLENVVKVMSNEKISQRKIAKDLCIPRSRIRLILNDEDCNAE
ncbi:MAG: ATP-binding protein [Snodgrassella sp.]|uniref:AAA family ATPase n=1 Tax=Snodgrassella sp. TaxID=2815304 RepID=UPI00258CCD6A|nr:AAA family ATPase [Snodgrassella sp.]MCO6507673.1 ATP-binding protein [Snodgrassella sp.]